MYERAIAWAEAELGHEIRHSLSLEGGVTSEMLALHDASGGESVLRLMTNEPWRAHGPALTRRERRAQQELSSTPVPAPSSLALDADGTRAGISAHLMSRRPGLPTTTVDASAIENMAHMLATIHDVRPSEPFRTYQSWAWEEKWIVPDWTQHASSWREAFDVLAQDPPAYDPTFLHRDFSHRNLLWHNGAISGVVDWVETSTGPAWLDAAHAATNLAVAFDTEAATAFLHAYGAVTGTEPDEYWLIMDVVGFLPPPGQQAPFLHHDLARLDVWLNEILSRSTAS